MGSFKKYVTRKMALIDLPPLPHVILCHFFSSPLPPYHTKK